MKKGLQFLSLSFLLVILVQTTVKGQCWGMGIGFNSGLLCPGEENQFYTWGDVSSASWDFGDGVTSTDHNPRKSFDSEGTYVITCVMSDVCGNDTTIIDSLVVTDNQPFKYSTAFIQLNNPVCPDEQFYLSIGDAYGEIEVRWNLDPSITDYSAEYNPSFSYSDLGKHPIEASITDACGNDTIIRDTVEVVNKSSFGEGVEIYFQDSVCSGEEIDLHISSNAKHFLWTFSDGQVSDEEYVAIDFSTTGNVSFSIKLTDYCGNDTILYDTLYVRNSGGSYSGWSYLNVPDTLCVGEEFDFGAARNDASATLDFGNGDVVTTGKDYYSYSYSQAGKYQVTYTVTDHCGNSSDLQMDSLVVATSVHTELPDNNDMLPDSICPGDNFFVGLEELDKHASANLWDFGDGTVSDAEFASHKYDNAGKYAVKMNVSGACGDLLTLVDTIYVGTDVVGTFDSDFFDLGELEVNDNEVCLGDSVSFIGWYTGANTVYFGDGNQGNFVEDSLKIFGEDENFAIGFANHAYATKGNYIAHSIIENGCGMKDTIYSEIIQVKGNVAVDAYIEVSLGEFEEEDSVTYCTNRDVQFLLDGGSTYKVDFGDGTTKTVVGGQILILEHKYTALGAYTATVEISNSCGDSDKDSVEVYVTTECTDTSSSGNGIAEIDLRTSVYPNPTDDLVNVDISFFGGSKVLVQVVDLQGRLLLSSQADGDLLQLSLRDFGTGLYFISVTGESGTGVSAVQVN